MKLTRFNKKGTATFFESWPEIIAFFLLVLGFIIGIFSASPVVSYTILFFCGMIFGRLWFRLKGKVKVPIFIMVMGFLIGFLLGSFYGNKKVMILVFVAGIAISYYLHDKKIVSSTEY